MKVRIVALVLLLSAMLLPLPAHAADYGTVGDAAISEKYINNWMEYTKVIQTSSSFKDMRFFAVAQEIKNLLGLQLLKRYKVELKDEEFAQYAKASETAKENENLYKPLRAKLPNVSDAEFYRSFFMSSYADLRLANAYRAFSEKADKKVLKRAEAVAQRVSAKPSSLEAEAKKGSYAVAQLKVSLATGIIQKEKKGQERQQLSLPNSIAAKEMELSAAELKKGQVAKKVITSRDYFIVFRSAGKEGSEFMLDAILIPKANYNEWFATEISDIPVKIVDPKIRKEVKERAMWASKLKIN